MFHGDNETKACRERKTVRAALPISVCLRRQKKCTKKRKVKIEEE